MSDLRKATLNLFDAWVALAEQSADTVRAANWYLDYTIWLWNVASARLQAGGATGFGPIDEAEAAGRFERGGDLHSDCERQAGLENS